MVGWTRPPGAFSAGPPLAVAVHGRQPGARRSRRRRRLRLSGHEPRTLALPILHRLQKLSDADSAVGVLVHRCKQIFDLPRRHRQAVASKGVRQLARLKRTVAVLIELTEQVAMLRGTAALGQRQRQERAPAGGSAVEGPPWPGRGACRLADLRRRAAARRSAGPTGGSFATRGTARAVTAGRRRAGRGAGGRWLAHPQQQGLQHPHDSGLWPLRCGCGALLAEGPLLRPLGQPRRVGPRRRRLPALAAARRGLHARRSPRPHPQPRSE